MPSSHRRHRQDKTVLSCRCRRCELGITLSHGSQPWARYNRRATSQANGRSYMLHHRRGKVKSNIGLSYTVHHLDLQVQCTLLDGRTLHNQMTSSSKSTRHNGTGTLGQTFACSWPLPTFQKPTVVCLTLPNVLSTPGTCCSSAPPLGVRSDLQTVQSTFRYWLTFARFHEKCGKKRRNFVTFRYISTKLRGEVYISLFSSFVKFHVKKFARRCWNINKNRWGYFFVLTL